MDGSKAAVSPETRCERLGDLAAQSVPAEDCAPSASEWALLEDRLESRRRIFARRWWPAFALSAVALACVGTWFLAVRPVGYRVDGCAVAKDGSFSTSATRGGVIAFSEGSSILLDKNSRFRVQQLARGAELVLDRGSASVAVVHRAGARWAVSAGPFRIEVTGTRFDVSWSAGQDRLKVNLHQGEVRISGGMLTKPVYLSAGQILETDAARASLTITDDRQIPSEVEPEPEPESEPESDGGAQPSPAEEPGQQAPSTAPSPSEAPVRAQPHKRAHTREETAASRRLPVAEPALAAANEQPVPDNTVVEPAPAAPLSPPPVAEPEQHAPAHASPPAPARAKPAAGQVIFVPDGRLSGPIHGVAWVTGGSGTVFTSPMTLEDQMPLRPTEGQLCTSGRISSVRCVNQYLPNMRCNWDRNWGVAIGWHLRENRDSWGSQAASKIAVEFHGRSSNYKLIAHLKNDPDDKIYCIENYKSGRVVTPSMFKSECWANQGDTLVDFKDVDLFQLNFPSGMDYVGFSYCVSAITLYP